MLSVFTLAQNLANRPIGVIAVGFCNKITLEKTALDRGRTDRFSLTHNLDLDLKSIPSYGHDLLTCKS